MAEQRGPLPSASSQISIQMPGQLRQGDAHPAAAWGKGNTPCLQLSSPCYRV